MQPQINRIKQKLDYARTHGLTCFGSRSHNFILKPPLSEDVIIDFEQTHAIRLPEAYRQFLLHVGNGGAGPYHGILPLQEWDQMTYVADSDAGYLNRPYLFDPPMTEVPDAIQVYKTLDDDDGSNPAYQGTMAVVHQGCSYYGLLVVTGELRGRIVYINQDRSLPFLVEDAHFLDWYERWLDELIAGFEMKWFGFTMPGTETSFRSILDDPQSEHTRRIDALNAIRRLPRLTDATCVAVLDTFNHGNSNVRRIAARVMGKFQFPGAFEALRRFLRDEEAENRKSAIGALAEFEMAWFDEIRTCLNDPEPSVVTTALFYLRRAGQLRLDELLPLFGSEEPTVRSYAVSGFIYMDNTSNHAPIIAALNDPDNHVQSEAVLVLGSLRSAAAVPLLIPMSAEPQSPMVLCRIIVALKLIGDLAAVPALMDLCHHEQSMVRYEALIALESLGDRQAIPAIQKLLTDHTQPHLGTMYLGCSISTIAAEVLQKLDGK